MHEKGGQFSTRDYLKSPEVIAWSVLLFAENVIENYAKRQNIEIDADGIAEVSSVLIDKLDKIRDCWLKVPDRPPFHAYVTTSAKRCLIDYLRKGHVRPSGGTTNAWKLNQIAADEMRPIESTKTPHDYDPEKLIDAVLKFLYDQRREKAGVRNRSRDRKTVAAFVHYVLLGKDRGLVEQILKITQQQVYTYSHRVAKDISEHEATSRLNEVIQELQGKML